MQKVSPCNNTCNLGRQHRGGDMSTIILTGLLIWALGVLTAVMLMAHIVFRLTITLRHNDHKGDK